MSTAFSSGSLNVIAREAGIAKGSLFVYFADKLELFGYVCETTSEAVRAHMVDRMVAVGVDRRAVRPPPDARGRLGRLLP